MAGLLDDGAARSSGSTRNMRDAFLSDAFCFCVNICLKLYFKNVCLKKKVFILNLH